ncbi:MAG: IucA/IucC family protein, partial [Acidimicrobiia bacterium]
PAAAAVDHAVAESLLRCWVREHGIEVAAPTLVLRLIDGRTLTAPVRSVSATGWHRFGPAALDGGVVDAGALVTVLADELVSRHQLTGAQRLDVIARTLDSRDRITEHALVRQGKTLSLPPSFLDGEQELVAGHPFHPAAKSREEFDGDERVAFSPELHGNFPLRWLAVDRDLVSTGSALARTAEDLLDDLTCRPGAPDGTVAVPLHPWQARMLLARPAVAALVEQGMITDLGDGTHSWYPTSSLRTVWRPGSPWMLKLSLGVRITNSRRQNLRAELQLGQLAHQLLAAGIADELTRAHPRFRVITDPAWIGVDVAEGGFDTAIRQNAFPTPAPVVCMAALLDERPGCGGPLLVDILRGIAASTGRAPVDVAHDWLGRYLDEVVAPLCWLDTRWGIVLEAHHQNTLVTLDDDGWPTGGWYRDNQGWYFAASEAERLRELLPAAAQELDAVFDDDLVARRGAYYLGVNNVFGLVGALGAAGVAPEEELLATARAALLRLPRSRVLEMLLHAARIPCKANLLTCADGRDELVGAVEHQSIYVDVPNPLAEVRT